MRNIKNLKSYAHLFMLAFSIIWFYVGFLHSDPVTNKELVKKVWLDINPHMDPSISPNICVNAQKDYTYTLFTAHVLPSDEMANVRVLNGPVFINGPKKVKDGDSVLVRWNSRAGLGHYTIEIYKDDCTPDSENGWVYEFCYKPIHNMQHNAPQNAAYLSTDGGVNSIGAYAYKSTLSAMHGKSVSVQGAYKGCLGTNPDKKYSGHVNAHLQMSAIQQGFLECTGLFGTDISTTKITLLSSTKLNWYGQISVEGGGLSIPLISSESYQASAPLMIVLIRDVTTIDKEYEIKPRSKQRLKAYEPIFSKAKIDLSGVGGGLYYGFGSYANTTLDPGYLVSTANTLYVKNMSPVAFSNYEIVK